MHAYKVSLIFVLKNTNLDPIFCYICTFINS